MIQSLNSQQDFASHEENTASSNYPYYIDLPTAYDSGFADYVSSKDGGRKQRWGEGGMTPTPQSWTLLLIGTIVYLSANVLFVLVLD